MTLRENIEAMTAIANSADKAFQEARTKLAHQLVDNRTYLLKCSEEMTKPCPSRTNFVTTFDTEYLDMFMKSFKDVDALLARVLTTGEIPEEDFNCESLNDIGIEFSPQSEIKAYFYNANGPIDIDPTQPFEFVETRTYANSSTTEKPFYKRWTFPDRFYYNPSRGGKDYGALYLYDKNKDLGLSDWLWNDEYKFWGPFVYDTTTVEHSATYDELLYCLAGLYGRCNYEGTSTTDWATWPEENVSLVDKIFKSDTFGYIPPEDWSENFKKFVDSAAIKIHTSDGKEYYGSIMAYGYGIIQFFALQPKCDGATGHEYPKYLGHSGNTQSACVLSTCTDEINKITTNKVLASFEHSPTITWADPIEEGVSQHGWPPPAGVDQMYISYSNDGQMLYKFDKFLLGAFGSKATTLGMDALVKQFPRKARDISTADYWTDWFSDEAAEYMDFSAIFNVLTTPRAVEQAASLYAVKFALLKVMYGHARRLRFG